MPSGKINTAQRVATIHINFTKFICKYMQKYCRFFLKYVYEFNICAYLRDYCKYVYLCLCQNTILFKFINVQKSKQSHANIVLKVVMATLNCCHSKFVICFKQSRSSLRLFSSHFSALRSQFKVFQRCARLIKCS